MTAYISELKYAAGANTDFVEVAVATGTDLSGYSVHVYNAMGQVLAGPLSLGSVQSTVAGKDAYVVDDDTPGFVNIANGYAVALVDDEGNTLQFVSFSGQTVDATEGPADTLTSTDIGSTTGTKSLQSDDGGTSYYEQDTPNAGTVPCYAPGTLIDTPDGPRAVETLKVGDLVSTLDHGPQAIRWTRSGEHPLEDAETDAKPVLIKAGTLGRERPLQDLIVSPQHRILVGGAGQLQAVFSSEAFAPAKSLTRLPGIRHMNGKKQITWVHFACERHEVVFANGCMSESLLLGPMVLNGLHVAERQALSDIFGPASTPDPALNGPPARECLTVGAVKRQIAKHLKRKIAKHLKEKGQPVAKEIGKWDRDLAMEKYAAERMREAQSLAQSRKKALRVA